MPTLKKDLQNSFTQFGKSIEKSGLDLSKLNPHSLYWDHEGMDVETYPVCTHVSEGEEDEELLKNLEALDPCGEFDDDAFPQRVQNFLRQYEEKVFEAVAETDIGRQPSRRSLSTIPGSSVGPDARSTPFSVAEERGDLEENNSPTRVGLKSKPRRLEQSETSEAIALSSPPHSSSLIDFTIPYIDPPLPMTIQETPKERKSVSIYTNVTNIIHEWTESLTYRRDNYAHFLSEDFVRTNTIVKLLVATERLDLQDIRESQPRTGKSSSLHTGNTKRIQ